MRKAVEKDPSDYRLWYQLASIATGRLKQQAIARTRELNPLGAYLPAAEG